MHRLVTVTTCALACAPAFALHAPNGAQTPPPPAAQSLEERLAKVERENAELTRRMGLVADELEQQQLGSVIQPLGQGVSGMGPAASKIYQSPGGVSIGGYGEVLFTENQARADEADALRTVLYVGYKFDETWLFNSEIEFEHGQAGESKNGEVSVEFAYLDGRLSDALNLRTGVLLVPMGFVNERHEPTTFVSTNRPFVERNLLPSTWREVGAGFWGSAGPVDWRAYAVTGLDAFDFKATGLRDGRQNAAKAVSEDFALVARADWHALDWLDLSGSVYWGDSGQGRVGADVTTLIWETHAEARWRSFSARALYAAAELDDVAALNTFKGFTGNASVGERLNGGYVEVACDLLSALEVGTQHALEPFVRYETYDTQASVPSGFSSNPANDVDVLTFGVAYRPTDAIVFKLDYSDFDNGASNAIDRLTFGMGFVF